MKSLKSFIRTITVYSLIFSNIAFTYSYGYSTSYNYEKSGWLFENNKWCYIDNNGISVKGCWKYIDDIWYNFDENGNMRIGWYKENDKWYYFDKSGALKTGYLQDNNNIYYLYPNGEMACGWINDGLEEYDDGTGSYFADNSGAIVSGYVQIDGVNYKLDPRRRNDVEVSNADVTKAYTTNGIPISIVYNSQSLKEDKSFKLTSGSYDIGNVLPPGIYNIVCTNDKGNISIYDKDNRCINSYNMNNYSNENREIKNVPFLNGNYVKVEGGCFEIISQK